MNPNYNHTTTDHVIKNNILMLVKLAPVTLIYLQLLVYIVYLFMQIFGGKLRPVALSRLKLVYWDATMRPVSIYLQTPVWEGNWAVQATRWTNIPIDKLLRISYFISIFKCIPFSDRWIHFRFPLFRMMGTSLADLHLHFFKIWKTHLVY